MPPNARAFVEDMILITSVDISTASRGFSGDGDLARRDEICNRVRFRTAKTAWRCKNELSVNKQGLRELVAVIPIIRLYAPIDPCEIRTAPGPVTAMPVFEAKSLDAEFEGQALLAAILFPTQEAQDRALTHGRNRAARACSMADPMTIEARFPGYLYDPEIEVQAS